jgi:hypothetical protein
MAFFVIFKLALVPEDIWEYDIKVQWIFCSQFNFKIAQLNNENEP